MDDINILQQAKNELKEKDFHLYKPSTIYRMEGGQNWNAKGQGVNHTNGVALHYYLNLEPDSVSTELYIVNEQGDTCRRFSKDAKDKQDQIKLTKGAGIWTWNMNYKPAKTFPGMINFWASMAGPRALPGNYKAILVVDSVAQAVPFKIVNDPNSKATLEDLQEQFDFVESIRDKLTETHQTILDIRAIRQQLNNLSQRLKVDSTFSDLIDLSKSIDSTMTQIEKTLYQTKNQSPQDPLNFPIRLNNKLGHLNALSYGDYPPTAQAIAVKEELFAKIDAQIQLFKKIKEEDIKQFNTLFRERMVDVIWIEEE